MLLGVEVASSKCGPRSQGCGVPDRVERNIEELGLERRGAREVPVSSPVTDSVLSGLHRDSPALKSFPSFQEPRSLCPGGMACPLHPPLCF